MKHFFGEENSVKRYFRPPPAHMNGIISSLSILPYFVFPLFSSRLFLSLHSLIPSFLDIVHHRFYFCVWRDLICECKISPPSPLKIHKGGLTLLLIILVPDKRVQVEIRHERESVLRRNCRGHTRCIVNIHKCLVDCTVSARDLRRHIQIPSDFNNQSPWFAAHY